MAQRQHDLDITWILRAPGPAYVRSCVVTLWSHQGTLREGPIDQEVVQTTETFATPAAAKKACRRWVRERLQAGFVVVWRQETRVDMTKGTGIVPFGDPPDYALVQRPDSPWPPPSVRATPPTTLLGAVFHRDLAAVRAFLATEGPLPTPRQTRVRPLDLAVSRGDTELVNLLLDHLPPHTDPVVLASPLDSAVCHGHADVVRLLVDAGAPLVTEGLIQPLHHAARYGHVNVLRVLLDAGLEASPSAFAYAIWRGNVACVRLLVERGADINICHDPERGHTPLESALAYGHHDVVMYLLSQGATRRPPPPPEWVTRRTQHRTLLHAIKKRDSQTVQALMHAGVSGYPLRITDAWPLVEAVRRGHLGVLMPLLAAGVSPNRFFDEAPLEVAAERGYVDVVRALLAAGAEVDQSVEDGFTPLLAAALHGCLDVVAEYPLKAGHSVVSSA